MERSEHHPPGVARSAELIDAVLLGRIARVVRKLRILWAWAHVGTLILLSPHPWANCITSLRVDFPFSRERRPQRLAKKILRTVYAKCIRVATFSRFLSRSGFGVPLHVSTAAPTILRTHLSEIVASASVLYTVVLAR